MKLVLLITVQILLGSAAIAEASKFDRQMRVVMKPYSKLHQALYDGDLKTAKAEASKIAKEAKNLKASEVKGEHAEHYKDIPKNLQLSASSLGKAKDLAAARESFKKLSQSVAMWIGMAHPKEYSVRYCSMAKASWAQEEKNEKQGAGMKSMPKGHSPSMSGHDHHGKGHKMMGQSGSSKAQAKLSKAKNPYYGKSHSMKSCGETI